MPARLFSSGLSLQAADRISVRFHSPWIHTMLRCVPLVALAAALPLVAHAQMQRPFPRDALRGEIQFVAPPDIRLNGKPARLSPGARVHGETNLLVMQPQVAGRKAVVHYTVEPTGLVNRVWFLTPEELAKKPWPRSMAEVEAWSWDPGSQSWVKP